MAEMSPALRRVLKLVEATPTAATWREGDRPKVYLLLMHAYGMGGTIRTVLATAGHLAQTYDVEVISLVRRDDEPFFAFPAGVTVTTLVDARPRRLPITQPLRWRYERQPSELIHPDDRVHGVTSLWTDVALLRKLRSLGPGVLMTTRASFNLIATRYAPDHVRTIGQEHLNFRRHTEQLRERIRRRYRKLDALVVLTERDQADYRQLLKGAPTRVVRIPNAVPEMPGDPSGPRENVVIAAGRLTHQKGFDLLIRAFEKVAAQEPDWTLRIFGRGDKEEELRALIADRGLGGRVLLMGATDRLGEELCKASIFALSSRFEGFGMVLIEAMSKGLPPVSFRCPRGPAEIINHRRSGLLVPHRDTDALADGILKLIRDPERRALMGQRAQRRAQRYRMEKIGPRWDRLVASLMPGAESDVDSDDDE